MRHRPCCCDGAGAPGNLWSLCPLMRARGTPDARRIRSLVRSENKHTSVVTTVTPEASGVPHAAVGTACCVRHPRWPMLGTPPLCGLTDSSVALCARRDGVVLPLGAKPMRRDDTPWAVRERCRRHRRPVRDLSGDRRSARVTAIAHRSRPPPPAPRLVTIATRPSPWGGMRSP
jgi:hypothetical protein